MDFGTIKTKLKEHKYANVREYMDDMELVFSNCSTYNAVGTDVYQLGKTVHEDYQRLVQQLYLNFYLWTLSSHLHKHMQRLSMLVKQASHSKDPFSLFST